MMRNELCTGALDFEALVFVECGFLKFKMNNSPREGVSNFLLSWFTSSDDLQFCQVTELSLYNYSK